MQKRQEVAHNKVAKETARAAKKVEQDKQLNAVSGVRATRANGGGLRKSKELEDQDRSEQKRSEQSSETLRKGRSGGKDEVAKITHYFGKAGLECKPEDASVADPVDDADGYGGISAIGTEDLGSARQPDLVSGGTMRSYQLEGLSWLTSLYENGVNGILADEMGLGKTIQTISFIAFLREKGVHGPFLVVAPLSTLSNWIEEFARWTPSIPNVLYHGSIPERQDLRQRRLQNEGSIDFPVVCTSFEICMNDQKFLSKYKWKFLFIVSIACCNRGKLY